MGTWLTIARAAQDAYARTTWLTVIRAAHTRRRLAWLTLDSVAWLIIYTAIGSMAAVLFVEGIF